MQWRLACTGTRGEKIKKIKMKNNNKKENKMKGSAVQPLLSSYTEKPPNGAGKLKPLKSFLAKLMPTLRNLREI